MISGVRSRTFMAAKVSCPTWPRASSRASYIARSSVSASPRQLRARRSKLDSACATSTGSGPRNERGSWAEKATASVTALPGTFEMLRSSHPVPVLLSPGVPDSMKSCASKWERLSA